MTPARSFRGYQQGSSYPQMCSYQCEQSVTCHNTQLACCHDIDAGLTAVSGHPNAPLTPAGRRRLCERVDQGRPIAHVAAEAGISRRCLAKWYARWEAEGPDGLADRSSAPTTLPDRTAPMIEDLVEQLRRETKFGAARLAAVLKADHGIVVSSGWSEAVGCSTTLRPRLTS
ncbi:helix-turn-helix domain-containing protein [Mycolicibacterium fortuitum]|uniref:Leucine zipper domain-containing protein n=2 Tax=Mycolicibacterium fortuitum TaxID=1766 RepID=A0AAE5AAE0_MYCFO|nr:leucine zipper domain-containing protein [Mycolicibacterium fortuitum]MDV7288777.1 leucine zipper domain-containing protein [Mycolicibacterium fortuitum]MDV7314230.1 leucine zipper domain-containing protein [Mycolicibacterium fortuitum]